MADVFLSYARPDAAAAERLVRKLEERGCSVWFDRELPAHRAYADVIATELESASAVLVLWSKGSVESQWVRSEANRARELGKLVQGRLDNSRLPMPFDQIQCADITNLRGIPKQAGWLQVVKSIDALRGSGMHNARDAPSARLPISRRGTLIGAGAAAITAAVGGQFWLRGPHVYHPSPEAALLLQKGIDALQSDDVFEAANPGSLKDAIALLNEATQADPRSAEAWGSLSLAYAGLKRVSPPAERQGLVLRSQSAAAKAFEIQPGEPRATGALLLLRPLYRHWLDAERADRQALEATPQRVPLLLFIMSDMLSSVGRCKQAAAVSVTFNRKAFIIPGADEQVLLDLWSAGDLQGADDALALAVKHWPQHPQVWRTRITYLMYSGRASDALHLLRDETERPPGIESDLIQAMSATASALAGQGDIREARRRNVAYLKRNPSETFAVAQASVMLGDLETAFTTLDGYYFAQGTWAALAPRGGDGDRQTSALFEPPMRPAWHDPRFDHLLQRTGLEDYWKRSRTRPDFRSGSAAA